MRERKTQRNGRGVDTPEPDDSGEPMSLGAKIADRARRAASAVTKVMGDGAVMVFGDSPCEEVGAISTGSIGLDRALGVGGVPRGRIIEVFGPESSGKTTLTLNLVAQAQAAGGLAAFIDAEHALDRAYAQALGVDVSSALVSQPDTGEEALELCERLMRDGGTDLIVVDSVAALVPKAEIDGDIGDQHMGLQARLMSQALRKLAPTASKVGCTLVFINQIRTKIGVTFGSPETTPGGRALRFYASVRLDIRRIGSLKDREGKVYGARARVRAVKNKVAPPHGEAEFDIVFGHGIDREGELVDLATERGILRKSGAHIYYGEERIGHGRPAAVELLRSRPEVAEALRAAVLAPDPADAPREEAA